MSFENLSLNIIEQIYLKLEPEDIANLCEVNEKRFKDEFCQNQDFWERYFLYHRQLPPPKLDIFQYYSNKYYISKLAIDPERVNKYISFIDDEENIKILEIDKLNYNSFKKLTLDFKDRESLLEFFENQGKENDESQIMLGLTEDGFYGMFLTIRRAPEEERLRYDPYFYETYFDKEIVLNRNQFEELIKILLNAQVELLDMDDLEIGGLEIFNNF